jgi:retinol dehydrogenase-12
MFVRQLAAHLPPASAVVPTSLTPGFCYSSFRNSVPFPFSLLSKIMEVFLARTTEMGSRTLVLGALMGENGDTAARENARGAYMDSCEVTPPSAWLFTKDGVAAEQAIWVSASVRVCILGNADTKIRRRRCRSCRRPIHGCKKPSGRT